MLGFLFHPNLYLGNDKNNDCEYLIRNSWGKGCSPYQSNECENGMFWISESDFHGAAYATTWIE